MGIFDGMARKIGLMDQMAQKLGADLQGLSPEVYRTAVLRCANCGQADACKGWLDRHDNADSAPGYCRNKSLMEALAVNT
jgi:hypothetical protein